MSRYVSIQTSIPAPEDRPDFAQWFAEIKGIKNLNPVYERRLNAFYMLKSMGINVKLLTVTNKYCSLMIVGVAVCGEIDSSIKINKSSL